MEMLMLFSPLVLGRWSLWDMSEVEFVGHVLPVARHAPMSSVVLIPAGLSWATDAQSVQPGPSDGS